MKGNFSNISIKVTSFLKFDVICGHQKLPILWKKIYLFFPTLQHICYRQLWNYEKISFNENIVAKHGFLFHFKTFLLLPQCFQKLSATDASKSGKGLFHSSNLIVSVLWVLWIPIILSGTMFMVSIFSAFFHLIHP